jgi:hypothetical protein
MDVTRTDKTGKILTPYERQQFHDDGIVFPIRVLSAEQAQDYRRQCDLLEAQLGGRPRTVEVRQMHLHYPWAWQLATEPLVLDAVEELLGPDLLIWATELFAKHPDDRIVSIGWHRDGIYMGLEPSQTVTAWIALSPSLVANGCMRFIREADRWAGGNERKKPDVQPERVIDVALQAGQMSLHDVHVLHGSGPNVSQEKRVGFASRFTTPQVRPLSQHPPAVLARGTDRYGYFDLRSPPTHADPQCAALAMRQSARQHFDATLRNLKHART